MQCIDGNSVYHYPQDDMQCFIRQVIITSLGLAHNAQQNNYDPCTQINSVTFQIVQRTITNIKTMRRSHTSSQGACCKRVKAMNKAKIE